MCRPFSLSSLNVIAALLVAVPAITSAADEPLVVERIADGVQATKGNRGHVHPAICVAKDGTVVVAHFAEAAKRIFVLRSTDGGRSFAAVGEVPDVGPGQTYPGALTTLADGRIVLTWNSWLAWPDLDRGRRPMFAVSNDAGLTWSAPQALPVEYHRDTWIRHRLLVRSPREWIFPMSDRVVAYDPQTATLSDPFPSLNAFSGPLVRTKAGTLQHGNGFRSEDEGRTWSKVAPFPSVHDYKTDLLALADGTLVAAVGAKDSRSFWLNASYDDGRTWNLKHSWVIYDPGHDIGRACPQLAELDAEHLGIVFWDHDRMQPGGPGVYFARLRLDELRRRTDPAVAAE
jgi:hypothetical protein